MAAAVALSIVGALHVYEATMADPPKAYDDTYYNMWKAGSSLVVVVWGFQVGWCAWSYMDRKGRTMGPEEKYTTIVSYAQLPVFWRLKLINFAVTTWECDCPCLASSSCLVQLGCCCYAEAGSEPHDRNHCSARRVNVSS